MPKFKLNGQELEFQPGDTIIRAAWRAGIEIPPISAGPLRSGVRGSISV